MKERLAGEDNLETDGQTIDRLVEADHIMGKFERDKRNIRFSTRGTEDSLSERTYYIANLKENPSKRFRRGAMDVNRSVWRPTNQ